jgi:hypothetical protein
MKMLALLALTITLSQSAFAGDCVLSVHFTACAGKEAEALKPYDGKNPAIEKEKKATSAEACIAAAEKRAPIVRGGTLTKKVVTATFDGKEVKVATGEKACN